MGFLASAGVPGKATSSGKGFLGTAGLPAGVTPAAASAKVAKTNTIAANAKAAAANMASNGGIGNIIKNAIIGLPKAIVQPAEQAFQGGIEQSGQAARDFYTDKGVVAKGADILHDFAGAAGALTAPLAPLFNPISQLITGAASAVNAVARPIANIPAVQRFANSKLGGSILDNAKSIAQVIQDASVVGGTVLGGLKPGEAPERAPVEAAAAPGVRLPVAGESIKHAVPIANDYREGAPIQMGAKPRPAPDNLPVIQMEGDVRPPKAEPGLRVVPEPPVRPTAEGDLPALPQRPARAPAAPKMPDEGTPSKAAIDVATEAAQKGFDTLPEEELARFTSSTKAEQIQRVANLMETPEKARAVALGEAKAPAGVHPQVVFNAVKAEAFRQGDVGLMQDLSRSPVAGARSVHAQQLGASGFNNGELDPVESIRAVERARAEAAAKRTAEKPEQLVQRARTAIRKTHTVKTWGDFIKEIEC